MGWYVLDRTSNKDNLNQNKKPMNKRRTFVLIAALFLLTALSFAGLTWASKTVNLLYDNKNIQLRTFERTVEGVLKSQDIVLGEKDRVVPALEAPVTENMDITIYRAFNAAVIADGRQIEVLTCAETVGEMLDEYNIELGKDDLVEPLAEEPLEKNMVVKVVRVTKENIEEDVPVKCNVKYQETSSLLKGQTKVINPGSEGIERCYWEVTYHDGEEVARELIRKELVKAPVDKVVQVGTQQNVSRGGESIRFSEVRRMLSTGYTHTGRPTASGVMPSPGTVAADTRIIPFGTRLYIDGYGYGTVNDRGSAIKGDRIDLFFDTREKALNWGRRWVDVYILE